MWGDHAQALLAQPEDGTQPAHDERPHLLVLPIGVEVPEEELRVAPLRDRLAHLHGDTRRCTEIQGGRREMGNRVGQSGGAIGWGNRVGAIDWGNRLGQSGGGIGWGKRLGQSGGREMWGDAGRCGEMGLLRTVLPRAATCAPSRPSSAPSASYSSASSLVSARARARARARVRVRVRSSASSLASVSSVLRIRRA